MKRDFLLDLSPGFVYDCLDWGLARLGHGHTARQNIKECSGIVGIDELHLGEYTLLLCTDPITDRVLAYSLVRVNDQPHMRRFVRTLQYWGLQPKVVVTDGSNLYPAEAVLDALDRELIQWKAKSAAGDPSEWQPISQHYLGVLAVLGDRRILAKLARRYQSNTELWERMELIRVGARMKDSGLLRLFLRDFAQGKLGLPTEYELQRDKVDAIIAFILETGLPEGYQGLYALAHPFHAAHKIVSQEIVNARPNEPHRQGWFQHPVCLAILKPSLQDTRRTGWSYEFEGRTLCFKKDDQRTELPTPRILANPLSRRQKVAERYCDRVALLLESLVLHCPPYHPLLMDAEGQLVRVRIALDRFPGPYRQLEDPLSAPEDTVWGLFPAPCYIPDIVPLRQPVQPLDVLQGRALFHFEGKGKCLPLSFPMEGYLQVSPNDRRRKRVLVLQAEIAPDGRVIYGVIGKGVSGVCRGRDVIIPGPLDDYSFPNIDDPSVPPSPPDLLPPTRTPRRPAPETGAQ